MATVVGVWSQILAPGKPVVVSPAADIRITNVALGDVVADASSRTTVRLTYPDPAGGVDSDEDEDMEEEDAPKELISTVVCSLTPGKLEQTTTDLVLLKEEGYTFESVGKNTIYLTGNYIDQYPEPLHDDFSDSDMDSDEEGYDLRDVSSDVEIDPAELDSDASRFEEVDELPKSAKRPRDSDAADTPKTKADKKANKKLKADDGKAVPTENGESKTKKDKKEKKEKSETKEKATPAQKELPGGLKIKDSKIGTGPMAKKGDTVLMRYIGKLQSGKVFDQNVKGKPFSFHLGKGEVIKGWDEGLVGMQAGGERVLTIPPHMAYGKKGVTGIPGNSTLTFECKLVGLK